MATGYALVDPHDAIVVSTVSPTRRAAMVNALVAHFRIPVFQQDTDEAIEQAFMKARGDWRIKPITVHLSKII